MFTVFEISIVTREKTRERETRERKKNFVQIIITVVYALEECIIET